MYDELIKSLREDHGKQYFARDMEAADAIEVLSKREADMSHNMAALSLKVLRAEEKTPRWISVEERLPKGGDKSGEICENVWLLFDDGNVYPGWMNGITEKVYYLDNYNAVLMKAPISRVKMWQPRPEPPKEE